MVTITGPKIKIVTSDISIRDELNEMCQSVGDQIDRIARLAEQDGADLECLEALLIKINGMMAETESILEQATTASTIAAWENWEKLAYQAVNMGMEEHILLEYTPFPKDRHQKIDKCIAGLRAKMKVKKERLAWELSARREREPEPFNYEQWNLSNEH